MSKDKTTESADVQAGSPENKGTELIQKGPSANETGGEPTELKTPDGEVKKNDIDLSKYIEKEKYEEFEKKLGEQGKELGDYKGFFKEVSPLLEKLQEQPELVQAILDGKITSELAEAALAGKVKVEEATKVAEAHKEIKKDMGKKEYEKASPDEIEKLISDKVNEAISKTEKSFKGNIKDLEDRREFETDINEFIAKTEDFAEHAEDVNKWLEENPTQYDVRVAYYAVKGKKLTVDAQTQAETKAAEAQKELAANAGGGTSQGVKIVEGEEILDKLIKRKSNPNIF